MNCRPGDLARIVAPYAPSGVGRIVEVVRRAKKFESLGECNFEHNGPTLGWVCIGSVPQWDGFVARELVIADECLRPIRNPGDDAVDESKAWLPPVPTINPQPVRTKENA